MNWEDVGKLRKAGKLKEASDVAVGILAADPKDFKTKSQFEWVIFEYIKRVVANITASIEKSQPVNPKDLADLIEWMRGYYRLQPRIPDMPCSSILDQLVRVAPHLAGFPDMIGWIGIKGLRPEDWKPNEYQGNTYPSLAVKIARALCKWAKAHPDASNKHLEITLEWSRRVIETAKGDDALWLSWDMAILLRQMGDFQRAAELLSGVIKAKRNEHWVWAEAGRLYESDQPELALACYCRALECPADPKFLVGVHRQLAELLAELEDYAQASREVAITIDIRQAQGWPVGREMEELISRPWYDPSAESAEDAKSFYAKHSAAALVLCFDVVETRDANYLGLLIPRAPQEMRPGWKPKPSTRFAIRNADGLAWSLIGPNMKKAKFEAGCPLTVVIGRQRGEDRQTIVHVAARPDGEYWDRLEKGRGVVVRQATNDKPVKVFVAGVGDERNLEDVADKSLGVGDGVRFDLVRNPKNDRVDVFNVERSELPNEDVKLVRGHLRRNPKGFAFVDDVFVAPALVGSIDGAVDEVAGVAVYGKHPKEDKRSWRTISLSAAS